MLQERVMSDVDPDSFSQDELPEWHIHRWSQFLGRFIFLSGAGLLLIWILDALGYVPFRLPDFWYPVRSFWWLVAVATMVCGFKILQRDPRLAGWMPTRAGRRFHSLILYTREGCHLCDEAKEMLEAYARYLPPISEVDIDKDAILIAKFTTCVPVVEVDGKIRFKGRIDEMLLRRLIEGSRPSR